MQSINSAKALRTFTHYRRYVMNLSILPVEHHGAALDKLEKVWQKLEELDAQSQPLQLNIPINARNNVPTRAAQGNNCYSELNTEVFRKMCDRANSTRVIKPQGAVRIR